MKAGLQAGPLRVQTSERHYPARKVVLMVMFLFWVQYSSVVVVCCWQGKLVSPSAVGQRDLRVSTEAPDVLADSRRPIASAMPYPMRKQPNPWESAT